MSAFRKWDTDTVPAYQLVHTLSRRVAAQQVCSSYITPFFAGSESSDSICSLFYSNFWTHDHTALFAYIPKLCKQKRSYGERSRCIDMKLAV